MTLAGWIYPWDIVDLGLDALAALLAESGVDEIFVAASYHSLLAAAPTNPRRRLIELPSSALYFRPRPGWSSDGALRIPVSPLVDEIGDGLDLGRALADRAGCRLGAWTVCLHSSHLVRDRPDLAVHAVCGDPVPNAPCLLAPEVRDYARNLVADVGARADLVQLESPHWTPQPHARHAKLTGAAPELSQWATSVCFCRRCRAHADTAGVDSDQVAAGLFQAWVRAWDGIGPDDPNLVKGMDDYLRVRADVVTALIRELQEAATAPVEVVSFGDRRLAGLDLAALEVGGARVRVLAYGSAEQVDRLLAEQRVAPDAPRDLHVGISILPEHVADEAAFGAAVSRARAAGAASVAVYHLGLAGQRRRGWLRRLQRTDFGGGRR